MTDIHSCSYYCDRPECIRAQRDQLRSMLLERQWRGLTDAELFDLWIRSPAETEDRFAFAHAIADKLREMNT